MTKIIRNNRLIALAFFTMFSMAASSEPGNDSNGVNHGVPVEMKFIGKMNEQPVFQLSFTGNANQNDFTITIKDEFNETLYRENIKAEHFSKKFLLNTEELGDATLLFEICCRKTKRTVIYKVNRDSRLVENVVISEFR